MILAFLDDLILVFLNLKKIFFSIFVRFWETVTPLQTVTAARHDFCLSLKKWRSTLSSTASWWAFLLELEWRWLMSPSLRLGRKWTSQNKEPQPAASAPASALLRWMKMECPTEEKIIFGSVWAISLTICELLEINCYLLSSNPLFVIEFLSITGFGRPFRVHLALVAGESIFSFPFVSASMGSLIGLRSASATIWKFWNFTTRLVANGYRF